MYLLRRTRRLKQTIRVSEMSAWRLKASARMTALDSRSIVSDRAKRPMRELVLRNSVPNMSLRDWMPGITGGNGFRPGR